VTHRRAVAVLRQGLALVVDRLTSAGVHTYTQTWHLAPDAAIDPQGGDVAVSNAAGGRTLTIHQADPSGLTVDAVRGRTSPSMQGWYSASYGSKVPAYALEFTRRGSTAQFATLLAADGYAAKPASVVQHDTQVDVCVDGTLGYQVVAPNDGSALSVTAGGC
jgi:hypothetical protein